MSISIGPRVVPFKFADVLEWYSAPDPEGLVALNRR
jgi:hypothetical protein